MITVKQIGKNMFYIKLWKIVKSNVRKKNGGLLRLTILCPTWHFLQITFYFEVWWPHVLIECKQTVLDFPSLSTFSWMYLQGKTWHIPLSPLHTQVVLQPPCIQVSSLKELKWYWLLLYRFKLDLWTNHWLKGSLVPDLADVETVTSQIHKICGHRVTGKGKRV